MTRGENKQTFATLFVDDEEKAQKYFRMAYANDFPVLTAGSVPEALEILEQRGDEIAVLITDQRMPGQQGVDLLKRAREEWPEIVRILTTAYSDLDDAITAVNRGEILRYVTKPWDIQALRLELRHAMDFFILRRERDQLLAEKIGVRRRMAQSDRLVGLLGIIAGLEHLRHAPYAVAAWVRDSRISASDEQPAAVDLELWGLEVREALDLMQLHRSLRALDASVQSGFPDRLDLFELLRHAGVIVEGGAAEVAARGDLVTPMIRTLARLAGDPATACWERDAPGGEKAALTIRVTGSGTMASSFTEHVSAGGLDAGLLGSYLIAWHHGGTLKATVGGGQRQFVLTLPEQPDTVVLPEPDENTLAGLFSMLEDWE